MFHRHSLEELTPDVLDLHALGLTNQIIVIRLQCSDKSISKILKSHGLAPNRKKAMTL